MSSTPSWEVAQFDIGRLKAPTAKDRRAHLAEHGPTAQAFTFRQPFPAPGAVAAATVGDDWTCPV